jgi:hypothetical protein
LTDTFSLRAILRASSREMVTRDVSLADSAGIVSFLYWAFTGAASDRAAAAIRIHLKVFVI